MIPYSEILSLTPSAKIELFVVDATSIGGELLYVCSSLTASGASIVWQGKTYQPLPIEVEGFEWNSKGTLPRPKIRVSNVDGVVGALIQDLDDLVGAKVTRKLCFAKHLDGMPGADPNAHWPDEIWEINQKTRETPVLIEFELISPLDAQGAKIPNRVVQATYCPWTIQHSEVCSYTATCAKTLAACKTFYPSSPLPFGGFPGTRRAS